MVERLYYVRMNKKIRTISGKSKKEKAKETNLPARGVCWLADAVIITRKKKAGKQFNNRRIVYGGEMLRDVHKENKWKFTA